MSDFNELFDRPLPEDVINDFLGELRKFAADPASTRQESTREALKTAVSAEFVGRVARQAAARSSGSRLGEAASHSMPGVLNAVKNKGRLGQAAVDKRYALHSALQAEQAKRLRASVPPALQKAAAMAKEALSPGFMRRAVGNASQQRLRETERGAASEAARIAAKASGTASDAHSYRDQRRLADMISDELSVRGRGKRMKYAAFGGLLEPTPEQIAMAEQQGLLYQTMNENQALQQELQATQGAVAEHAEAAEQAGVQAQQSAQQLAEAQQAAQQVQQQAQEAMAQAQQAQAEAQVHAQNAAQQADGKMRLAIRIQQIRQQLADLASQDPVAEEGEQADPVATATQQQGTEEQAALEQQTALEQQAAAGGGQAAKGQADAAGQAAAGGKTAASPLERLAMRVAEMTKEADWRKYVPFRRARARAGQAVENLRSYGVNRGKPKPNSRVTLRKPAASAAKGTSTSDGAKATTHTGPAASATSAGKASNAVAESATPAATKAAPSGATKVPPPSESKRWSTGKRVAVGTAAVATGGALGYGAVRHHRDKAAEDAITEKLAKAVDLAKAKGMLNRYGELLTGSRVKKLEDASARSRRRGLKTIWARDRQGGLGEPGSKFYNRRERATGKLFDRSRRLGDEASEEWRKSLHTQVGTGIAGAGALGGAYALGVRNDQKQKNAAATDLAKATGLGRVGQLLSGSRATGLQTAAAHAGQRLENVPKPGLFGRIFGGSTARRQSAVRGALESRQGALAQEAANEAKAVRNTRLAAGGLAAAGAVGAGMAAGQSANNRAIGAPIMPGKYASLAKLADEARKRRIQEQILKNRQKGVKPVMAEPPAPSKNTQALSTKHRGQGGAVHDRVMYPDHPEVGRAQKNVDEWKKNKGYSDEAVGRRKRVQDINAEYKRQRAGTSTYQHVYGRGSRQGHYDASTSTSSRGGWGSGGGGSSYRSGSAGSGSGRWRPSAASTVRRMRELSEPSAGHVLAGIAGAGALAGAGYLLTRKKNKPQAAESKKPHPSTQAHPTSRARQPRTMQKAAADAPTWDEHPAMHRGRVRATYAGVIPGAVAGGLLARGGHALRHVGDHTAKGANPLATAAWAAGGGALGALGSRARFNAQEAQKDVAVARSLAKERASRMQREYEKQAMSTELSDTAIDQVYGL